ncbi:MAG: carbohydrate ABC transporter permease [Turicibacter sp.]
MNVMKKTLIGLLSVVWLFPFFLMILIAFQIKPTFTTKDLLNPQHFTFDNFTRAWNEADFSTYFLNTVMITVVSVILILLITSLAGYIFAKFEFRGKKAFMFILFAAMGIPAIFFTIPVYQVLRLMNLETSIIGIILAEVGSGHVIFLILFSNFFRSIPSELEEAAAMDGANAYQVFYKIMFPLAKPIIGTVVITQAVWTWNSFLFPLILSLNNPNIRTLSVGLYSFQGENVIDWTGIAAGACMSIIPIIILFLIFQNFFINGIAGAIKE